MIRLLPLAMLALALSGCGARRDLRPAEGRSLPPAPLGARETPTPRQLISPTAEQRPARSDELLRQSEERQDDPFALPPAR